MKKMLAILLFTLLFATPAWALPKKINFQSRLTDSLDAPIITTVDIAFSIYDVSAGGPSLWDSVTLSFTPDSNGVYEVLLGDENKPILNLPFDKPYYLGVAVGSDSEMTRGWNSPALAMPIQQDPLKATP